MGGPLKKYTVTSASGVETVMKLNQADARFHGVLGEPEPAPVAGEGEEKAPVKKRATSNKARTAANKDGGTNGGDD